MIKKGEILAEGWLINPVSGNYCLIINEDSGYELSYNDMVGKWTIKECGEEIFYGTFVNQYVFVIVMMALGIPIKSTINFV